MKPWNVLLNTLLLSLTLVFNSAQASESSNPVLNINNASIEQLEMIKGIGAKKAQAIIEYRLQHGSFAKVEDLTKVKGIGSKFVAKNRTWMSVQ